MSTFDVMLGSINRGRNRTVETIVTATSTSMQRLISFHVCSGSLETVPYDEEYMFSYSCPRGFNARRLI